MTDDECKKQIEAALPHFLDVTGKPYPTGEILLHTLSWRKTIDDIQTILDQGRCGCGAVHVNPIGLFNKIVSIMEKGK